MVTLNNKKRKPSDTSNSSKASKRNLKEELRNGSPPVPRARSISTSTKRVASRSPSSKTRSESLPSVGTLEMHNIHKSDSPSQRSLKSKHNSSIAESHNGQKPRGSSSGTKGSAVNTSADTSTDSNGILSSLFTAAHNAANIISSSMENEPEKRREISTEEADDKKTSFGHKLDFLLKPGKQSQGHSPTPVLKSASPQSDISTDYVISPDAASNLSTSNVRFESIRESPLNTMGHGELTLNHFLPNNHKRPIVTPNGSTDNISTKIRRSLSPDVQNRNSIFSQSNGALTDAKRNRLRSNSNLSGVDKAKSQTKTNGSRSSDIDGDDLDSEDNASEDPSLNESDVLDNIGDYNNIKFASKKRNQEFHHVFKNIPPDERLFHDLSCALSKDILVQGRMYLSEHYICFNSNILGWVTNLTIPFHEVIKIEKKSTAVLFPNGIVIRTLHRKYVFATFLARDSTFLLITNIWHKVLVGSGDVDESNIISNQKNVKLNLRPSSATDSMNESDSEESGDESISETEDEDTSKSMPNEFENPNDKPGSDGKDSDENTQAFPENKLLEKSKDSNNEDSEDSGGGKFNGLPLVGPTTHSAFEPKYSKESNETFIAEEVFKAPLGTVFLILFGSDSSYFIKILKNQKNYDIAEGNISGLSEETPERNYTYMKPLNGPIGPKQTKCLIQDKLIHYDLESYILIEQTTSTPDVPSGNSFQVRTKLYLSWAENNCTKLHVLTGVEWSGKSWIKGAVEKGSIDGQKESMSILVDSLSELVKPHGSQSMKTEKKKKKRRKNSQAPAPTPDTATQSSSSILQLLTQLQTNVGSMAKIPYLSEKVSGTIVIMFAFIFVFYIYHQLLNALSSRSHNDFEVLSSSRTMRVKINDKKFLVIPSVDNSLSSPERRMRTEVNLWNWVKERSGGSLDVISNAKPNSNYIGFKNQEVEEIVRLSQLKLDEIKKRL
ncbi:Piso0_005062 [Millerozyma farinosa CBS 7064]|uniref:Piso0_005062 protein n=1 Tax=Pichia sorbitophila (strain ATCC MYA-4447 / BCRC 22081 / CBS 7064 / NBRC 10061 / NRRL Y-12695) TaxID=559304 RepID=G8Y448_PICSO|nr:Piso0_005062 [Millerozyma farinosa CBS 7064]